MRESDVSYYFRWYGKNGIITQIPDRSLTYSPKEWIDNLLDINEIKQSLHSLEKEHQKMIIGNLINRDITLKARKLIFENFPSDFYDNHKVRDNFYQQLGNLIKMHHEYLKNSSCDSAPPKAPYRLKNILQSLYLPGKSIRCNHYLLSPQKSQCWSLISSVRNTPHLQSPSRHTSSTDAAEDP